VFFTLDAGLLARSQYSKGPATGHNPIAVNKYIIIIIIVTLSLLLQTHKNYDT